MNRFLAMATLATTVLALLIGTIVAAVVPWFPIGLLNWTPPDPVLKNSRSGT